MSLFPASFMWGASSSPHQVEGNNTNSDWWAREASNPGMQASGDAVDSYHRYAEDMSLLSKAGLNSYRFGIEWARVQPRPDMFSHSQLAHYRRMIETAWSFGLKPIVTLHHFTSPQWFKMEGGWTAPTALDRFAAYVTKVTEILRGVEWVVTINEPNILSLMISYTEALESGRTEQWTSPTAEHEAGPGGELPAVLPAPNMDTGKALIAAHHAVRDIVRGVSGAKVGWSVANQAFTATEGNHAKLEEVRYSWEDIYLDAAAGDDFIGVQAYSSQPIDENGPVPHPPGADNTQVGTAFRPDALQIAVRHAAQRTGGIPIVVTENGIATADDAQRIAYTSAALDGLALAMQDGVDVRGYMHWSALDNYEWGHWEPTFGLISVNRNTFERTPKPSLAWLGGVATANGMGI